MKKIMILLMFVIAAGQSFAQTGSITIYNVSPCEVTYSIRAGDDASSDCDKYQSVITTLAGGTSVTFANAAAVTAAQGWTTAAPGSWYLKYVKFFYTGYSGGGVGSPCFSNSWTYSPAPCTSNNTANAHWAIVGSNVVVVFN